MRYIRTPFRIVDTEKENCDIDSLGNLRLIDEDTESITLEKIIKESDDIEDLFDEIVVKYYSKVEERYMYMHLGSYNDLKHFFWYDDDEYYVYGSIYTDEGIIYAAKTTNTEAGVFEVL